MEEVKEGLQDYINSWWDPETDGNETSTTTAPGETMAPVGWGEDMPSVECAAKMDPEVQLFWDLVYAMLVLLVLTIMVPWIFCCCRGRPRCLAHIYALSGFVKILCGLLMATILVPFCPVECRDDICKVHRYNPTSAYGAVCVCIGFFWLIKACWLRCSARKMEREAATGVNNNDDNDNDEKSERTELTIAEVV